MEYYLINIICNIGLVFSICQFLGDSLQFDFENKNKVMIFSSIWVVATFAINEWLHIPMINLIVNILLMLLIASAYEGSLIKKLLTCIFIAVLGATCDMLAYVVATPFLKEDDYFYSVTFTVLFLLIIERALGVVIRRGKTWDIVGKEMLALSGFPVMAAIILYCVTAMDSGIYRFVACICVVGISLLSVSLYNSLAINLGDRMRKEYLEREVEAYRHEMELMRISNRKEENLRHDLRHHLFEIEGLAKQGKNEKVCDYIEEMRSTFADSKQMVHTGEYETDSLINYLLDSAKNHQITVDCDIKIPEDIDVSQCKLNVIVGNLLENAIDAAAKAEEKKIIFTMQFSRGVLFLRIKNTYGGNIKIENGRVHGKRSINSHGIGLRSVQDLISQQNGNIDIKATEEFFVVEGMIPLT
ncbi:sensor histidine kinase [Butyrivibrio sp. MC2021]|uniref:sensor histidine kinase n=1 Tax=Butyrivibrio sp. MC2021 TaxID=1408306 RepID=UPI00047DBB1A|nr:GHKL domain-containing protein [Butyrivibrio sp. MC2021]